MGKPVVTVHTIESAIKSLIEDIIDLCQENKYKKKISERILRGRAAPISNQFEERFASLLETVLPPCYRILIDYPISYVIQGRHRKKTSYPDIAIIRDGTHLVGIIELKIDLGYLRDDWSKTASSEIAELKKASEVNYQTEVGSYKGAKEKLSILPDLPYAIVVLTSTNDHGRWPEFSKQPHCYALINNLHPNARDIDQSNKQGSLLRVCNDDENLKNWKHLANFLIENFP